MKSNVRSGDKFLETMFCPFNVRKKIGHSVKSGVFHPREILRRQGAEDRAQVILFRGDRKIQVVSIRQDIEFAAELHRQAVDARKLFFSNMNAREFVLNSLLQVLHLSFY
jgi:hypothetical protein